MSDSPFKVSVNIPGEELDKTTAEIAHKLFGAGADEAGGLLADIIGLVADPVRAFRHTNRVRIIKSAVYKIRKLGISEDEMLALPMREIPATIESISNVDEQCLSDLWSGLIASATNPRIEDTADRSFTATINMMTECDAVLFSCMVNTSKLKVLIAEYIRKTSPTIKDLSEMGQLEASKASEGNRTKISNHIHPVIEWMNSQMDIAKKAGDIRRSVDNMLRLGIVDYGPTKNIASNIRHSVGPLRINRKEDPVDLILKVYNDIDQPRKRKDLWKSSPIETGKGFLPNFNIHATSWGERFATACMIDLPDDIKDLFL